MKNNYDIDYLINLAYEYYYLNLDKCYTKTNISLDDINNINNIKFTPKKSNISLYINQIFNTNIDFLYKQEHTYYFIRHGPINTLIKLRVYPNIKLMNNINFDINNDLKISFLLSNLLTDKKTINILLTIFNIDLSIKNLIPFLTKSNLMNDFTDSIDKYASISICENFTEMISLNELFNKYQDIKPMEFLSIIFQVIYTLVLIRKSYPNFSHNLLNIYNIYIYINQSSNNIIYKYNNINYNINNKYIIKIFNFELSNINSNINKDISTFFNSLQKNLIIKKYLENNLYLKKIIIESINMIPEDIMQYNNFLNNFTINKLDDSNINYNASAKNKVIIGTRILASFKNNRLNNNLNGGKRKDKEIYYRNRNKNRSKTKNKKSKNLKISDESAEYSSSSSSDYSKYKFLNKNNQKKNKLAHFFNMDNMDHNMQYQNGNQSMMEPFMQNPYSMNFNMQQPMMPPMMQGPMMPPMMQGPMMPPPQLPSYMNMPQMPPMMPSNIGGNYQNSIQDNSMPNSINNTLNMEGGKKKHNKFFF